MISSRKLSDLHPDLRPRAEQFITMCDAAGIDVIITCTYRDDECQDSLYAQGRTTPGNIVTNARAGESAHNVLGGDGKPAAMAFDFVPVRDGKLVWDKLDSAWQQAGAIATSLGLLWAGYWTKFKEYPHCQLPGFIPKEII